LFCFVDAFAALTPNKIINPHCLPSRMTIGHIMETVMSKLQALRPNKDHSGDAFQAAGLAQRLMEQLHNAGFQKHGNEVMYDPHTGQRLGAQIFMGLCYYQRLKHMVADKIHGRSKGPVMQLTKQPTEGRGANGGLRFGEMEKDAMIAHGAAVFLNGRLHLDSDSTEVHVCETCGVFADGCAVKWGEATWQCATCVTGTTVRAVRLPYACKLLLQELRAMNIGTKINF
jgi:DNA-directed RNA polymerase II subunit RPB2